jgi:hypothetical protein
MSSLWDIRIFLGLVPKESPWTWRHHITTQLHPFSCWTDSLMYKQPCPQNVAVIPLPTYIQSPIGTNAFLNPLLSNWCTQIILNFKLLKQLELQWLLQHVSVHIKPSSGSHSQCLAKITCLVPTYVSLEKSSVLWWHILFRPVVRVCSTLCSTLCRKRHCLSLHSVLHTRWSSLYNFSCFNNFTI